MADVLPVNIYSGSAVAGHSSVVRPFQRSDFELNKRNEDEVSAG